MRSDNLRKQTVIIFTQVANYAKFTFRFIRNLNYGSFCDIPFRIQIIP